MCFFAGCGGGGDELKLLPVQGTVTQKGKAIEGIKVMLESSDPKSVAPLLVGTTDQEGAFEIQTSAGEKGAPVGMYKVVLAPKPLEMDYANAGKKRPKLNTELIPKNFQSASTTELSYEVKASATPLTIEIP